tara:strand:- start:1277 stop:2206 length:930 start_codon:yes stop_codon:yes gene_type:complete
MRKTALNSVYNLAKENEKIIFIGSDLGPGVLDSMKKELPDQFFMEGVSEQHIIGMAAGLAMEGFIPFVNTIATFLTRRCYEQIALDLCLQDLPVRLIANGGGGVYAPLGPTHLAVEDLAIMRVLPNMTVLCPCDADEMKRLMSATLGWTHPIYIRLAKGGDKVISKKENGFEIGKAINMAEEGEGLFITTGVMTQLALEASEMLASEGIQCGVLHVHTIKPLDDFNIIKSVESAKAVITVEEHTRIGGLGSAVLEILSDKSPKSAFKVKRIGIPDKFADQYGNQNSLLGHWDISVPDLCKAMKTKLNLK